MSAAEELFTLVCVAEATRALGVSRATRYRRKRPPAPRPRRARGKAAGT